MTDPKPSQPEPDAVPPDAVPEPDAAAEPDAGSASEETTRIALPEEASQASEETTRIELPSGTAADAEQTTRIALPDDEGVTTQLGGIPDAGERATAEGPFGDGILGDDGGRTTRMAGVPKPARKLSATSIVIAVLVGLMGFALVVQVRGTSTDSTLASARQDDLVRILSDLDSNEDRLRTEIADLEQLKRELTAGSESQQAAKEAAEKRADELGILAGTLPAQGPGLAVKFSGTVRAARILDAVEELRNAGAEAMQISGSNGTVVRIIVSSYFVGPDNEITVDGQKLVGPYTITVIGDPATMKTALNIPGGVVATVSSDGGNVIVDEPGTVRVTALAPTPNLQYAQPAS
jgi:uncharacterized protein YlxW (UPF0749 family)